MGLHEVLQEIERLGQSRRLIPAEQVIMSALLSLDPFLAPGLTDEALSEIQAKLLQLYNANQSEFSIQCSLFIASKLLVTYQLSKNPQVWDLFSLAISKNCTTVIMAAGFICRRIGDRFKAQLPRLAEHLLKQKANVEYAAAYCLRGMFKSRSSVMSNYIPQTIEFCRRVLALSKQATTVAVIKLLKILVRFSETNVTQVLGCVRMLMKEDQIPFIKNELSMLIARIAFEPLGVVKAQTTGDENEWALDGKASAESGEMSKALEVIEMFPSLLNMTFRHFLELLSPEMYERSHAVLYPFVRSKCNQLMSNFVVMLPRDVRYTYFCEAGKEAVSGEQLRLLNALCPDNELNEAAGVALLLASSDDKGSRDAALEFFALFSKSHPSATLSYLRSALAWLSSPPVDDARLQANIRGNSALVYTILSNLPRMEDALVSNEELFMELVSNTFRGDTHNTQLFTGVLWILSVLPEKFVVKDMMSRALKKGVALLATLSSLAEVAEVIDALLAFQSRHLFVGELFDLMKFALSHSSKLSLASIAAISELGPLSGAMSLELVKMILFTAYSINPTGETMKEMISRNLPTGFDLLKISQPMSMEKRQEQESLVRIVNAFPALLNALVESDRQQIYDLLMRGQIINSTVHLLLLSICRSPFPMPKDTLAVLLRLLESNNISQLEIISECVAYFCAKNRSLIPTVFKVVEKQMSRSSCILLSSLFTHVNVPKEVLSRAMVFLSSSVTNGELVPFAMHAFSSALLTHSIQMSSLRASANQLGLLFQILQTTVSMQPVALRLCSECFTLIIEDLSGDLTTKGGSLRDLVNLILRTIEFTPISYAREMYFECSRSILTFCHNLSNIAPINFPLYSGVPSELQMVACETFTEALHFQHLYLAISQLTNPLLMLLQRTGDHRVADFLTVLATTSGDDSLSFWVSTLRRVLSENSLVTSDTPIEPVAAVKVCCLAIAKAVLPKLAEKMVLKTENLDDIISSASNSTETNRLQLQEAAFPVLKLVIDLFKNRQSDTGGRLLELYDSQFSQAVQTGFKLNLAISGGFLSTYLTFLTSSSNDSEYVSVIREYMKGISQCKHRTTPYYALATHMCIIATKRSDSEIVDFMKEVAPGFQEIAYQAMKLWKNRNDWRALASFRDFASEFYGDLLTSLVWIQKFSPSDVDIDKYMSFFISEVLFGKEDWMIKAAYHAIPMAIEILGRKIPVELIELALRVSYHKRGEAFVSIVNSCAHILEKGAQYDATREMLLSIAIESPTVMPSVIANVVLTDSSSRLRKYYTTIAKWIIDKYMEHQLNEKTSLALLSLLCNNAPDIIGYVCNAVLGHSRDHSEFVLNVLQIALPLAKHDIPLVDISRFCIAEFKKGGMLLIGHLLLENPELGLALLSQGGAKASFLLCQNDITNARPYLRFIQLSLATAEKYPIAQQFSRSVFKLVVQLIASFGSDVQIGHQIIGLSVSILFDIKTILGDADFQKEYDRITGPEKEKLVSLLTTQIAKSDLRHRNANLVAFSTAPRNKRSTGDDEWGELEISD